MKVQNIIEEKLRNALEPMHLEVVNESHKHNVPVDSETHFKVTVVSVLFEGKRAVARHQLVYKVLADELTTGVHALALHTYSADEWVATGESVPASPPCSGGSKNQEADR